MKVKPVYLEGDLIGHARNITAAKDLANADLKKYAPPGESEDLPRSTFRVVNLGSKIELVVAV